MCNIGCITDLSNKRNSKCDRDRNKNIMVHTEKKKSFTKTKNTHLPPFDRIYLQERRYIFNNGLGCVSLFVMFCFLRKKDILL